MNNALRLETSRHNNRFNQQSSCRLLVHASSHQPLHHTSLHLYPPLHCGHLPPKFWCIPWPKKLIVSLHSHMFGWSREKFACVDETCFVKSRIKWLGIARTVAQWAQLKRLRPILLHRLCLVLKPQRPKPNLIFVGIVSSLNHCFPYFPNDSFDSELRGEDDDNLMLLHSTTCLMVL